MNTHPIPWESLPKWANWAAMDEDGQWRVFQFKPSPNVLCWFNLGGFVKHFYASPFPGSWKDSLQQRPKLSIGESYCIDADGKMHVEHNAAPAPQQPTREQLLEDNRRLREALEKISKQDISTDKIECLATISYCAATARNALASAPAAPEATYPDMREEGK